MNTTVATGESRGTATPYRVGLVLAALLGLADIVGGISQLGPDAILPFAVAVTVTGLGVITLVLLPLAWRGTGWASWTIIAARTLSAITTLPAFFVPVVPVVAVITAAATVAVTVLAVVLMIVSGRTALPATNP